MTPSTSGIGPLLRSARDARGWTHEDVVRRIDAGLASYSRWERGKNTPQGHNLQQLIEVLGLDPAEAIAAAGGAPSPGVQAERALDATSGLADQVERLTARVTELEEKDRNAEERLAAMVDAIVAARLAEIAVTSGTPQQHAEPPRAPGAQSG